MKMTQTTIARTLFSISIGIFSVAIPTSHVQAFWGNDDDEKTIMMEKNPESKGNFGLFISPGLSLRSSSSFIEDASGQSPLLLLLNTNFGINYNFGPREVNGEEQKGCGLVSSCYIVLMVRGLIGGTAHRVDFEDEPGDILRVGSFYGAMDLGSEFLIRINDIITAGPYANIGIQGAVVSGLTPDDAEALAMTWGVGVAFTYTSFVIHIGYHGRFGEIINISRDPDPNVVDVSHSLDASVNYYFSLLSF